MNYFDLFALPHSFEIDLAKLSAAFQSLQKMAHPDKFAHASSQQQLLAVQKSANINDAYQILKTPIKRAEYMLQQRGTDMPSEQTSFQDTLFLMRQMELHEMLEELPHADDIDGAVNAANETLDNEYQILFCQLQQLMQDNNTASDKIASEIVRKLKFYQKLQLELERIEEQLFDE
ncbi:MAG: co-chaperone HscB [Alteromonadaceae bacterium]|nr:co-chaperone HscB [Alteromonadaceae bacterium]